jgi:hypothetical protein
VRARALALLLLCASTASAAEPEQPDALIAKGIELRERGKDAEALALFKRAHALSATARARAQVALAEQALGMWIDAERDLVAALAVATDPWIVKNRAALDGALATIRRHLGDLEVRGHDAAEVYLDGLRLGTTPGPFRVEAGKRTLEVRARGFVSTTRAVDVPAGGVARETVALVAEEAKEGPAAPPSAPEPRTDGSAKTPVLGWSLVGGGGALILVGVVGLLVRQGIIDDYNASTCPGLGAAQPPECNDQVSSSRTWLTVSIASFAAGGILAGIGGVLVLTAPKEPRVACGPAFLGAACGGTF